MFSRPAWSARRRSVTSSLSRPASSVKERPQTPLNNAMDLGSPRTQSPGQVKLENASSPASPIDGGSRPASKMSNASKSTVINTLDLDPKDDKVKLQGSSGGNAKSDKTKNKKSCVRKMWRTRETDDFSNDQEGFVRTTLRELIIYLFFIAILAVVTFGMVDSTQYYFNMVLTRLFFENFKEVTTTNGIWEFLRGPLLDGLYTEKWYNEADVTDFGYILHESKLLGVPRLRQIKVRNDSCIVHDEFLYEISECFSEYSEAGEDKSAFGLGLVGERNLSMEYENAVDDEWFSSDRRLELAKELLNTTVDGSWNCWQIQNRHWRNCQKLIKENSPLKAKSHNYTTQLAAWNYVTSDDLDGSTHKGKLTVYGGGGYVQDLGTSRAESAAIVEELENNLWIDRGTRVLFVDFTVYNANINLFCQIRLVAEFPATGGVFPTSTFRTLKLLRYVKSSDYLILGCECIFCIFILYYIVEEFIEIKQHRLSYFKRLWNWLDIIVIFISIVCVAFNVFRTMKVGAMLDELLHQPKSFPDFEFLGYWQKQFNNIIAVAVFFAWIKIFKYISFNKTMNQLSSTLSRCAKDVAGFTLMFFVVFLAFVQLAYLVFGTQIRDFSSIPNCIFTQLRIILGDFDFQAIEKAHGVIGPLYFFTYIFFVFFVLMNMFLAIINDTYAEVKEDLSTDDQLQITDYFKQLVHKLGKKREKIVDIQAAVNVADSDGDRQVDFAEWRKELIKRGYEEAEISAVFEKYDEDGDKILSAEERRNMLEDLQGKKEDIDNQQKQLQRHRQNQDQLEKQMSQDEVEGKVDMGSDDSDDDGSISVKSKFVDEKGVSNEEFQVLNRRVDKMEVSIGSIVSKIDGVLDKLVSMEKIKTKRRETMNKLLQNIAGTQVRREDMERLVKEELERWDSDVSISKNGDKEVSGSNENPDPNGKSGDDGGILGSDGNADAETKSGTGDEEIATNEESPNTASSTKTDSPHQIVVGSQGDSATNC